MDIVEETPTCDSALEDLADYIILPLKFDEASEMVHYAYFTDVGEKTIKILNIPPYCNEDILKNIFSQFGKVMHCTFTKDQGFKQAIIEFKKSNSSRIAKQTKFKHPHILSTRENPLVVGYDKYYQQNKQWSQQLDAAQIQKQADAFMESFDREQKMAEAVKEAGTPDEAGWVTVTRKGKKRGVARSDRNQRRAAERERRKRQANELVAFYRFQMRDKKRDEIETLKRKFEEDKKRVEEMKAKRKFKPF